MNHQLAAHHQLTLQAFQSAVDSYQQRGIALPEQIAALVSDRPEVISQSLESHLNQLDALSESDPHFEMLYQAFRSGAQNDSSQRAKFLDTSAPPNRSAQNGLHAVEIKSERNGHAPSPGSPESNGHTNTGPPTPIKRFVLPLGFTESERAYFDQYIQSLKQLNPEWVVAPDRCQPGEATAYVMLRNDENYTTNHAIYLVDQVLNQAFT
jgi:hypothetical protein